MDFLFTVAIFGGVGLYLWSRSKAMRRDEEDQTAPKPGFSESSRRSERRTWSRTEAFPPPIPEVEKVAPTTGTATGRLIYDVAYRDAADAQTRRRIEVVSVDPYGEALHVAAWCSLRDDYRTFRADRILELVDAATGEVFPDPLRHFAALDLRPGAAGPVHQAAIARARPGLVALTHIARADGETSEAEIEVLFDWIRIKAGADAGAVNPVLARLYINNLRATFGDAAAAMDRMPKKDTAAFDAFAGRMTTANGAADPAAERRRQRLRKGVAGR